VTAAAPEPAAHESILRCTACAAQVRVGPDAKEPPRCEACGATVPWLVAALVDTFDREVAVGVPVLVDFWAAWCVPCRMVTPLVARAAKEHAGALKVVKVNVDRVPQIADRFKLLSIPTLSLLRDGVEVDRVTGGLPPAELERFLAPYLTA
jgi:thioredoxin 2